MKWLILFLLLPLSGFCQYCNYTAHANISLTGASDQTIYGDSLSNITLTNCINITIRHCRIHGSTGQAITISGGSGFTIDSVYIDNVQQGLYAENASNVSITNSYIHNVIGASGHTYHPIQFNNVLHGHINYNKILEDTITTQYTHDQISLYKSNGSVGDSITVIGNLIYGGQTQMNGTGPGGFTGGNNGATGINLLDSGGSYQVARDNTLINPGYTGMQIDGAGSHAKMDHNRIYSKRTYISLVGMSYYTTNGGDGPGIEISYNHITWNKNVGGIYNKFFNPSLTQPTNWTTNTADSSSDALANSSIITLPMVTDCGGTPPPPPTGAYLVVPGGTVKLQ